MAIGMSIAVCLSMRLSIEYDFPHTSLISHGMDFTRIQKLSVHGGVSKKSILVGVSVLIGCAGPYDAHQSGGVHPASTDSSSSRKSELAILDTVVGLSLTVHTSLIPSA